MFQVASSRRLAARAGIALPGSVSRQPLKAARWATW